MQTNYQSEWQNKRVDFILSKYSPSYFSGKRVLELAPYNGYIGARLQQLGAIVHCIEGRQSNTDNIKAVYPELSVECANLDTPHWIWGKWDIIVNFGLLYHLELFHRDHLINCCNNCNLMLLESVIFDSDKPELYMHKENGADQSLTLMGGYPSTSFVENVFKELDVSFEKICDPALNAGLHHYNWVDTNSRSWEGSGETGYNNHARRFWIVKCKEE